MANCWLRFLALCPTHYFNWWKPMMSSYSFFVLELSFPQIFSSSIKISHSITLSSKKKAETWILCSKFQSNMLRVQPLPFNFGICIYFTSLKPVALMFFQLPPISMINFHFSLIITSAVKLQQVKIYQLTTMFFFSHQKRKKEKKKKKK